jgi:hypothetical protein
MKPGSQLWRARVATVLAEEEEQPLRWFYASFSEGRFLGALFMKVKGPAHLSRESFRLGLNPGGQMLAWALKETDPLPEEKYRNRLLDEKTLKEAVGPLMRIDGTTVVEEENEASGG